MAHDLKVLIAVLNPACRQSLEDAAAMCVEWGHHTIELEHLLARLLKRKGSDLLRILEHFSVDAVKLEDELKATLSTFRGGNKRVPTFSENIPAALQEAWLIASLMLDSHRVRSGAILLALRTAEGVRDLMAKGAPSLRRIDPDRLRDELKDLIRNTAESGSAQAGPGTHPPALTAAPAVKYSNDTPALDLYTVDMTARAREGAIDPIIGREPEIRQVIDILTRRRQNNPMLVGEAGVGKTAVVEGLALRIAEGQVPPVLRGVALRQLDLALLQAGASLQGEFEKRLKSVIHEVKSAVQPVILFIDEAHTLIGAGGAAGQSDAANLLKPALARGELRTVAATTWDEYKQHLESDPALARRFQVVKVDEPDTATAIEMLRAVATKLERHHHVRIREQAVHDAVTLSQRYLTGRRLPDKALSVLDTAAARVAVGQRSTPGAVQDAAQHVARLEEELTRLEREQATHADHRPRLAALMEELEVARRLQVELESRWEAERAKVEHIREVEYRLETRAADPEKLRASLVTEREGLVLLQGDQPMVPLDVDGRAVAEVVASWTGVPVGRMLTDEAAGLLRLPELLGARIIGQPEALDTISRRMRTSRAGLVDPNKPVGVFLLLGPSGVGKTETAAALADALYGGAQNMVVVNLSEYQEAHSVALLKGAPPGYVGYARGGVLTEAVRRRPYSVVLLDEVEKAHPDVLELFYQVFDKGTLEDGQGVVVDFRNTALLLTSNAGAELIQAACQGKKRPDSERLVEMLRPSLLSIFPPALLGRLTLVPYYPLGEVELRRIVGLKVAAIQARFSDTHHARLVVHPAAEEAVLDRCLGVGSGARSVDHILAQDLLPLISSTVLERMLAGALVDDLVLTVDAEDRFVVRPAAGAPPPPKRARRRVEAPAEPLPTPRDDGLRAQEERMRAHEARLRAEEEGVRTQAQGLRSQEERLLAREQALRAQEEALRTQEERNRAQEERNRAQEARNRLQDSQRTQVDHRPPVMEPVGSPTRTSEVITARPDPRDTAPGTALASPGLLARMANFLRGLFQSRPR